jgi:saccharopine dehydrogenase (NAD+, L-lysine-forming)
MSGYKLSIIGAGLQGAATASILARDDTFSEVFLCDINIELARNVTRKIGSDKIISKKVDANNIRSLVEVIRGSDVVINMSLPRFNINIMKACLMTESFYVDTASGPDYELHPIDYLVKKQFELDKEYKEKELVALISSGFTPGLSNVIAKYVANNLNVIDSIKFRVGGKSIGKVIDKLLKPIENYIEILYPTWSPEVSFLYRATKPVVYHNGKYIHYEPYSGLEVYEFPEPVGKLYNVLVDHEEPVTLPLFIGKGLRYVDYKNPPDILAYTLIKLGFADSTPVKINDTKVIPRDVLLKMLKPPVNLFLNENRKDLEKEDLPIHCEIFVIDVIGEDDMGKVNIKAVYKSYIPPLDVDERLNIYDKFGTIYIHVALPAVVGAKLLLNYDRPNGVIAPEALDPEVFLKTISNMGLPIKLSIYKSREITE